MTERLTLSVVETAEALGVSDDLVYELIARGALPAVELGRRKMIPVAAIDMVIARAMDGFDPDVLLASLAGAAHSSTTEHGNASVGEWTGTTGPTARQPQAPPPARAAAPAAPVVHIRR